MYNFCKFVAKQKLMKKYIFLIIIIFFTTRSFSSHFVGGEITWECISDATSVDFGKYIFQLKVYRDCTGIDFSKFSNISGNA